MLGFQPFLGTQNLTYLGGGSLDLDLRNENVRIWELKISSLQSLPIQKKNIAPLIIGDEYFWEILGYIVNGCFWFPKRW